MSVRVSVAPLFSSLKVVLVTLTVAACGTLGDGPALPGDPAAWPLIARGRPASTPDGVQLVGMEANDVNSLLGEPYLTRLEKPAEYRHYEFGECALDLYLYKDKRNGRLQVAYWEVRANELDQGVRSARCGWLSERLGALPGEHSADIRAH